MSPASAQSSPILCATPTEDLKPSSIVAYNSKQSKLILTQEISALRAQVYGFTSKSQQLEAQLEKKDKQLIELSARAADEAEKCKAAKKVIKTLTVQLKEMAVKPVEFCFESDRSAITEHMISTERHSTSVNSHNNDSNGHLTKAIHSASINSSGSESNGNLYNAGDTTSSNSHKYESNCNAASAVETRVETGRPEKVVQDEPGVYVTLYTLPMGVNELKLVRFSRRRFTAEQAEKWWSENRAKLCERHNIRTAA